ncbi:DUF2934 domain-containing protein [Caballeronia sp. SBC2]|nr:hypothetical protein SBC2_76320 [Caballeronia sp. SBC2]
MYNQPIEKRIRERAYALWLADGAMEVLLGRILTSSA